MVRINVFNTFYSSSNLLALEAFVAQLVRAYV